MIGPVYETFVITYKEGEEVTPERIQLAKDTVRKTIEQSGGKLLSCEIEV